MNMTLQFPTLAEQTVAAFNAKTKTAPFEEFAKKFGGEKTVRRAFDGKVIEWVFDDETSVTITGAGLSHRIEIHLP